MSKLKAGNCPITARVLVTCSCDCLAPFPLAFPRSFGKLSAMIYRIAHICRSGQPNRLLSQTGALVRLRQLQGPACGRFMR